MVEQTAFPPSCGPVFVTADTGINDICTGVQRHFVDFIDFLREQGCEVHFVGAGESEERHPFGRVLMNAVARSNPLFGSFAWAVMRYLFFWYTWAELRQDLRTRQAWFVYANDPVTSAAALRLRRNSTQRVVIAVHYNVSQANEMANRGLIPQDGWFFRLICRWVEKVIRKVDGIVTFSQSWPQGWQRVIPLSASK